MKPSEQFTLILTWHHDAGHAWLEVPAKLVDQMMVLDQISEYSYYSHDAQVYFLEEDCDAAIIIDALKLNEFEIVYRFKDHGNQFRKLNSLSRVGGA